MKTKMFHNVLALFFAVFGVFQAYGQSNVTTTTTGTNKQIPKFTTGTNIENSQITDDGTNVGINDATPSYRLDVNGGDINLGTTSGTFKIGGANVLWTNGNGSNIFVGGAGNGSATGNYNVFIGSLSGTSHTTGTENVFIGYGSGSSNVTGLRNTFCGYQAGQNSTANYSTFIGMYAGKNTSTGGYNTFVGSQCGESNTKGIGNDFYGNGAGFSNTTAGLNVAIGSGALYSQSYSNSNTAWDSYNIAVGFHALSNNAPTSTADGIKNTALGYHAGYANTTGYGNTFLGYGTDNTGATTINNSTAVGNSAVVTASNTIVLGNSTVTGLYFGTGSLSTSSSAANMFYDNSTGQILRSTSSARYKKDIVDMEINTSKIYDLRPVTYTSIAEADHGMRQFGLVAEEVAKVIPELAYFSKEKDVIPGSTSEKLIPDAVQYPLLAVLLLKEVQQHKKEIENLKALLEDQNSTGHNVQNTAISIHELELASNAVLFKNAPNPFGVGTSIKYFIPESSDAMIVFYDELGNKIKDFSITGKGMGQLDLSTGNLASGMYSYSLIVNGKVVDTKKMMRIE